MSTSPAGWISLYFHWCPQVNLRKVFIIAGMPGSSRRKSGVPRRSGRLPPTALNQLDHHSYKIQLNLEHPQAAAAGIPTHATAKKETAKATLDCTAGGRPALSAEFSPVEAQRHPLPPPAAQPPHHPLTPRRNILRVPFYNTENFTQWNYGPLVLCRRFLFSMHVQIPHNHFDGNIACSCFLGPFQPHSYPTHETPISTSEGPTTMKVAKRRIQKKGTNEERRVDQWLFHKFC